MQMCSENSFEFRTFLINLSSSKQRLAAMTEQLRNAGIEFERLEAVDGRGKAAGQFREYDQVSALKRYGRPMSGPEVGVFLSHRQCVENFLRSSYRYALVLEDDVFLPAQLSDMIKQILSCLDEKFGDRWHVVNLGNPPRKYFRQIATLENSETLTLSQAFYFPLGAFGLLWSRSGAQTFLENTKYLYDPVDQLLRDWCATTGMGFAVSPSLIGVDRSQSYIRHRLTDRLKLNLPRYWLVKNLRLLKNHRRAVLTMKAFGG